MRDLDCKVILYIRRQDDLITSSWQQWYSKKATDFDAWLPYAMQTMGHWQKCIEGWETVVGAGNVIVRVFQRSDLVNGDVVDDFLSLLSLGDMEPPFIKSPSVVNPSYSDIITPIVSGSGFIFSNEHDNGFYSMLEKLTGGYYVNAKKVSLISREQRECLVSSFQEENELVCRKYFPGRLRLFEATDHAKYEYLSSEELTRRQLQFLTSLVFAMYKKLN